MIPVSLTIKGLYSYQQETTIDFTNLTAAGLFGIFGAVGSGKSTILEAITFALYGETERLNSRDSRSYNMMNLKSNELLIDFIFTCGDCEDTYKFTVSARRNRKKFNDAGTFERKAYIFKDNWLPTSSTAESILGLSYDNFKRTVIIPQGKFQEFLQLKEGDRVQMLKELFNLEKFELSPKVSKLTKENEIKVSNLQGQMQTLPVYDEEILKEKEKQISELDKAVKELTDKVKNCQLEDRMLQDLKNLFADVESKTVALNVYVSNKNEINYIDRKLKEFENCELVFKNPIENRNKLFIATTKQQDEAKTLQLNKAKIEAIIESETSKVLKLKDAYASRELLLQKATELEKIINIKSLQISIDILSERIMNGEKLVQNEEAKLEGFQQQIIELKEQILEAEQALPDTAVLVNISKWFGNKQQIETVLEKTAHDALSLSDTISAIKSEINLRLKQLPNDIIFEDFPESLSTVKDEIDAAVKQYDHELIILNDQKDHLNLSQKLDEFARSLTDETECPLCGSIHHPKVFSAANVTNDLHQKQMLINTIENIKVLLNTTLINLSGSYSNYETFSAQLIQKQQELEKQKIVADDYAASFSFSGYTLSDEELVKKQLSEIEKKNAEIKNLRKQRDDKDRETDDANKKIKTYKAGVDKFKTDKAQQEGQLATLKSQVLLLDFFNEINKQDAKLSKDVSELKLQHAQITKEFEQADNGVQENNKLLATLKGRIDELEKQINISENQLKELNEEIVALLVKEGYESEVDVEEVLSVKMDVKKEKNKVENFRKELHAATIQLAEATAKVEGKKYNEAVHLELQQTAQNLSKELADKTEKLVTEKFELQELKQRMQDRLQLQKDLDELILRAENLKILSNLFRSSGFVNYVSSVYLQNLINSANQRFYKMTRQKLMLELADDNSFRVRDFMNNGEVRSVKTLSGGQTFQAALSLALALADNIQHLTKSKQNFFFLDEGFGSLDKDSLAIVFETLKSLRKENRIVGVISHVDEMQQEIQVNLKIVNDIEKGSIVTKSWNGL